MILRSLAGTVLRFSVPVTLTRPPGAAYDAQGVVETVPAWVGSTIVANKSYALNDRVLNGGSLYRCTTGGIAAIGGTGPTGTGSGIVDGTARWAFVEVQTASISAVVQRPAAPGELLHLPEGDRVHRTCSVWTTAELRHRDVITLADGERYELQAVGEWASVAGFWQAVGVKVPD